MRAVVQRVAEAAVSIGGQEIGRIGRGLVLFLGVGHGDTLGDVDYLVQKVAGLRIFPDGQDRMNRSLLDVDGDLLVVSQFTLWGDCRKGRRPSFSAAAEPEHARQLYDAFVDAMKSQGVQVATGRFQETMAVGLVNDGPVTLLLDSRKAF
jgi:D-tyrosyl-tRNA(Tyr) deacylase